MKVTVINECIDAVLTLVAPADATLEYIVGDEALVHTIPAWTIEPADYAYCNG
jgi:hypothetical protein